MKLKSIFVALIVIFATVSVVSHAATMSYNRVHNILTYCDTVGEDVVKIQFNECMANQLFTFSSVNLNGTNVNVTGSDNIGPFLAGGCWMGGNHLLPNNSQSAYCKKVRVYADGEELALNKSYKDLSCKVVEIVVTNELVYADKVKFCDETMRYRVSGNSIEVWGSHKFCYPKTLNIDRYYGMQSMFIGETEILLPGTEYQGWTKITPASSGYELNVTKKSAPEFTTYIEHSPNGYQAAYLTREGLGDRHMIDDNDVVFIGNSWSKSYHKTIGGKNITAGDSTSWHGIYTWFSTPVADTYRENDGDTEPSFEYQATINGAPTLMHLDSKGRMTTGISTPVADAQRVPIARASQGKIVINPSVGTAYCYNITGALIHKGSGTIYVPAGIYIVTDRCGNSAKLLVR